MEKSDSIIIIPTYNEKENIENIIRAVFGLEKFFHILIIEDNSPDGTATIVRKLQTEFPDRLFMVERKGKLGLGTAYIAGFKWAIEHQYDFVFEMDADFSHNPNDLPRLYNKCAVEGYDVAIGSRYVSGVNVVNWPMGRVLMSYFASKYVRIITRNIKTNCFHKIAQNARSISNRTISCNSFRIQTYSKQRIVSSCKSFFAFDQLCFNTNIACCPRNKIPADL